MNQEAMPYRQKGFHFAHTPPGFDVVFNLFKSLVTSTLQTGNETLDCTIHPNTIETIYDHIPRKCLPTELGGSGGSIESIIKYWEDKLVSYRDFFLEEKSEGYGIDESKRPNRLHNTAVLSIPIEFGFD